jgi:DMSO/TMAO reductase YedYZ molybdopterin-dependent catalytic subunit
LITARRSLFFGAVAGAAAGVATLAAMYLAAPLAGIKPLPEELQQPVLAVMPGPVFGFLIDRLQHAGKVLEEAGLLVVLVVFFALLGALYDWVARETSLPFPALIAAAAGWLVVVLVLLPLSGEGLLGIAEGLVTPIAWALLFALFALILQLGWEARPAAEPDYGRRRVLGVLPLGLAGLGLAVLGFRLVPDWYRAIAAPPESGLSGPSPELTPVGNFYVVSKNFSDPVVDSRGWMLAVQGLVDEPLKLSYQDLRALPATTEEVTLECVSNNVGGDLMSTGSFTGVRLRDLLAKASPRAEAGAVVFHARDGYAESLPLDFALGDPDILVAYDLDGGPLPSAHGFPARILIPGRYGMKGPKWLDSIELAKSEQTGYWEGQGWDRQAVVKTTARIDVPGDGALLKLGPVQVAGVAFAGVRGIQAVELSADGGKTWRPAELKPPLSALTWVLWTVDWTPAKEGAYQLQVRARDGQGQLQSSQQAPSFPNGASGYHSIFVNVGS